MVICKFRVIDIKNTFFLLTIFCLIFFTTFNSHFNLKNSLNSKAQNDNQFPFVGQEMQYEITQSTGSIISSSGTLDIKYLSMINETLIYGLFHVEVTSIIKYYNESAIGIENLNTRHLQIDADDTYIIFLFMVYFFEWPEGVVTPTPVWVFPHDIHVNSSVKFWNYTTICSKSQSISIMDKYYEVFVFRQYGTILNMTLMFGYAKHNNSEWYGLLFYMSGVFFEPVTQTKISAFFKLANTNAELKPLDELNRKNIISITISFYSTIILG